MLWSLWETPEEIIIRLTFCDTKAKGMIDIFSGNILLPDTMAYKSWTQWDSRDSNIRWTIQDTGYKFVRNVGLISEMVPRKCPPCRIPIIPETLGQFRSIARISASMGIWPDTQNCGCACAGNVFPTTASKRSRQASRHVRDARAVMHAGIVN